LWDNKTSTVQMYMQYNNNHGRKLDNPQVLPPFERGFSSNNHGYQYKYYDPSVPAQSAFDPNNQLSLYNQKPMVIAPDDKDDGRNGYLTSEAQEASDRIYAQELAQQLKQR
jgi:hypothetical protein